MGVVGDAAVHGAHINMCQELFGQQSHIFIIQQMNANQLQRLCCCINYHIYFHFYSAEDLRGICLNIYNSNLTFQNPTFPAPVVITCCEVLLVLTAQRAALFMTAGAQHVCYAHASQVFLIADTVRNLHTSVAFQEETKPTVGEDMLANQRPGGKL